MEKVYFDPAIRGVWVVKDLDDFYQFKYVKNNEEFKTILNWTKNRDREEELKQINDIKGDVRLYQIEIEERKINFTLYYNSDLAKFVLQPATVEDDYELDMLSSKTGCFFVGEKIED